MSPRAVAAALGAVLVALGPRGASAEAVFQIVVTDRDGVGFNDPTPVAPVGGNAGRTLGEQRRNALQHAADLWGQALDSEVPVVIEAEFKALGCADPDGATLAYAGTTSLETGLDGEGANPNWIYVAALANRLMGEDLHPDEPDIGATFNLDVDAGCLGEGVRWYYGLDSKQGGNVDFVNVALHELGHGLGVHDLTVHETGVFLGGLPNPYAARVLDLDTGKHWHEMSDRERVASMTHTRRLVWDGPRVTEAAPQRLAQGSPRVQVTPPIARFSGLAGDATFGASALAMSMSARLVSEDDGCPLDGVSGRIALLRGECAHSGWVAEIERSGAAGAILSLPFGWSAPPPSIEEAQPEAVQIPVLTISDDDAERLHSAVGDGDVMVHVSYDAGALRGTDAQGRLMLNATVPSTTSSVSHWDMLARPNLLMEPFENAHDSHDVDLTPALLADIGWSSACGNGHVDEGEQCDAGAANSDVLADTCRTTCRSPRCGDGVVDGGEGCDDGEDNSDERAGACRSDCGPARCGDGVRDAAEACDDGAVNGNGGLDGCRQDCLLPGCGDGRVDPGEQCDTGAALSATAIDGCRPDCTNARCGDGVVDTGETCDAGDANDDRAPGACREDCRAASCGDGALDPREQCDDGDRNSDSAADACRSDCRAPRCGDGVKDRGEACDGSGAECAADCSSPSPPSAMGGSVAAGNAGMGMSVGMSAGKGTGTGKGTGMGTGGVGGGAEDSGCGCRVAGAGGSAPRTAWALALLGVALGGLRSRARKRALLASR